MTQIGLQFHPDYLKELLDGGCLEHFNHTALKNYFNLQKQHISINNSEMYNVIYIT